MKILSFLGFAILLLSIGCKNDPAVNQSDASTGQTASAIDPAAIKFVCEPMEIQNELNDAPRHEVYLIMAGTRIKVADILNCEPLPKENYAQFQIPDNAIAAAGGWWAGAGDYFYLVEEAGNYVLKQGSMDESAENNDYGYKTIMTFDKSGKEVF